MTMCSEVVPKCSDPFGGNLRTILKVRMKPYLYETVNGKRKRISPYVFENGVIVKIIDRAIISVDTEIL